MAKMDAFKGDKAQFLPKRTYKDKLSLGSGKDRIDLYYFGAGPHQRRHVGRTIRRCACCRPATCSRGGTRRPSIATTAAAASSIRRRSPRRSPAIKDVDTVIPGHSPVTTPKDLQEYQRYMTRVGRGGAVGGSRGQERRRGRRVDRPDGKYPGYKNERAKTAITAIYAELKK